MRKFFAILLTLFLALGAAAASAEQTVTVSGAGEVYVAADTAVVSLGVSIRKPDALQAQSSANEVIAAIRAALTGAGFSEEDINTGYVSLWGVYDYNEGTETISAYNASSTLAVKVTDMTRVGEVIDLSFGAGANTLDGVQFSVSDDAAAREQAMKNAVADAKAKAAVLAEAAGIGELEIKAIQDGNVYSYDSGNNYFAKGANAVEEAAAGAPTDIRAAKIAVSATVTIVFETK